MAVRDARLVHVSIQAPLERVYAYAADPRNLPRWAPNFGHAIAPSGEDWVMETADGPVRVRFAPPNDLGVLDHWVTVEGGEVHNPVRVVANGSGSLVVFTVFAQEGWSPAQLDADAALVQADLQRLKAQVESAESTPTEPLTLETHAMHPRLDLIGIVVNDMARSLAFYRALGLDLPPEADAEPHVEAKLPGGLRLAWDTVEVVRSFDPGWQPPSGGNRMGMAFLCDSPAEVDAAYERLVGLGYHGHKPPWDAFWGQRYAVVHDPDGNGVDLFAPMG